MSCRGVGVFVVVAFFVLGLAASTAASSGDLKELKRDLLSAVKMGEESAIADALRELSRERSEEAATILVNAFGRAAAADPPLALRLEESLRRSLEILGAMALEKPLIEYLGAKDAAPFGCVVLLAAGDGLDQDTSERWLIAALESKHEIVLRNAIDRLVYRRSKNAIPALIDQLEDGDKRTRLGRIAIRHGLISLTGLDLELVGDWRKFWEANQESFDPADLEESGTTGVARMRPEDARESNEFFGVEVPSDRVAFLIDVSGSMRIYHEDPTGRESWQARMRISQVKRALIDFVKKLKKQSRFNIISFGDKVETLGPKLLSASSKNKRNAIRFVERMQPNGETRTDLAFQEAFKDLEIDTIVLLSDGAPQHGEMDRRKMRDELLKMIRIRNRFQRAKIFTLGFDRPGKWPPGSERAGQATRTPTTMVRFLTDIAKEHGGTFTPIRD